jgi:hypothetical protein
MNDLLDTYERLKAEGIVPHGCLDHGLTTSFYYLDPDGNSVELQCDNFGDWAQSSEWMRTAPEFADDPIGKHIDPDGLVAARPDGASPAEIHRRAYAGEFTPDTHPWTCACPDRDGPRPGQHRRDPSRGPATARRPRRSRW